MSGYRCVNFSDLCRLCSSPSGSNSVQIFPNESLQKKISDCLQNSITLNEKDKLPKVICSSCQEYVETFSDFRKACTNTEKMLLSCLNTSKLRNNGQVYIKDEIPVKKILKPIQNPSPTKIIPNLNLCNILATASSPTKQVKKNIITTSQQQQPAQDFLSSIIKLSGIQTGEETGENASVTLNQQNFSQQSSNSLPVLPQYTLTLDGSTLKSGQIQYKIENSGNILSQLNAKSLQDIQNQQAAINQVDELFKLKQKPSLIMKKDASLASSSLSQSDEPKDKKPKFNLILQATPQKQIPKQLHQQQSSQTQILTSPQSKFTSPNKAQILNIENILPGSNQTSPPKQVVVPVVVGRNNSISTGSDAATAQLFCSFNSSVNQVQSTIENKAQQMASQQQQQPVFVQMKIQPNADGQLTLTPATQQQIQLALSPQQIQQLSFQTIPQQQQQQQITVQPSHISIPNQSQAVQTTTAHDTQTQTPHKNEQQDNVDDIMEAAAIDGDDFNDTYDDNYHSVEENENESVLNISQEKSSPTSAKKSNKKSVKTLKPAKVKVKRDSSPNESQAVNAEHSEMAKKQLNQLTNYNNKRTEAENSSKANETNLTVCDVCKKIFKRKEFLMQHLKSHIGLRPFKCPEPQCNKSFSRKEHLHRHISSHTGQKEFICNVCNKLFSRKDNLNKHRRIHPESGQQGSRQKLAKNQTNIEIKTEDSKDNVKTKSIPIGKKIKVKIEKTEPVKTMQIQNQVIAPAPPSQQQPKLVQVLQSSQQIKTEGGHQQQQQQSQKIILSMSQAQALLSQTPNVYAFPSNYIFNSNGTFSIASSNDLV